MERELNSLFSGLTGYFSQHKAASGEEIQLAIKDEVSKVSQETREVLEKWLESDLEQALFRSVTEEGISIYSPDMTARRNYLDEIIYHPRGHTYPAAEIEKAYRRLMEIRAASLLTNIENVIRHFLEKLGYRVDGCGTQETPVRHMRMTASRREYNLLVLLMPSITFVPACSALLEEDVEMVMVVPTEKTPGPFIQFFRSASKKLEARGVQVWVVNPEAKTVNPLLGSPKDEDIFKNFENPRQSLLAARIFSEDKLSRMTEESSD